MTWKTSQMSSDGNKYEFFQQEKTNQCGPAAVAMMLYYKTNKKVPISTISNWFKDGESQKAVSSKTMIRDFEAHGSWYDGVIAALGKLKIYAHATKGCINAGKWVVKTEKKYKPAIVSIGWWAQNKSGQWVRNGGHWILALKVHSNNVLCLDPGANWGVTYIPVADSTNYTINYGGGWQKGYVDGIILP